MDNFQDFQKLFDEPDTYNFLSCELPDENRKCGVFLPGWMSYSYPKEKKSLASFLNLDEQTHKNLAKVEILVSDKEKNEAIIDEERKTAAKSNDGSALLKHTMYFPKNTREIFLSESNNNFPIEAAKAQGRKTVMARESESIVSEAVLHSPLSLMYERTLLATTNTSAIVWLI
jgi:hypothetical protein